MGVEAQINLAILKAITASSLSPVAYPNVAYDGTKPYYRASLLPVPTEPLAIKESNIYSGILQISVVGVEGIGQPAIDVLVSAALSVFPRNTQLTESGTVVRFDKVGWVSPAIQAGNEYIVPISFSYLSLTKEN